MYAEFVEIHKMQNLMHLLQKQKEKLYKFRLEAQIIEFLMGIDKIKGCSGILFFFLFGVFLKKVSKSINFFVPYTASSVCRLPVITRSYLIGLWV